MGVLIDNRQEVIPIDLEKMRRRAMAILSALESETAELSIVFADDSEMAELNRRYLKREGPTNVIAFPMKEGDFSEIAPELLGDVVISVEYAEREAKDLGVSLEKRLDELLVHGILHLFGYDHEKDEAGEVEMEKMSRRLLEKITDLQ